MLLAFVGLLALPANAQIKTPQASTSQTISQTVGLTDITLEYSRPSKRERVIFGGLVPYDKMWQRRIAIWKK